MPNDEELKAHLNTLLDELKWFRSQEIGLRIRPARNGWNLQILPAMTAGTHFVDPPAPEKLTVNGVPVLEG